MERLIKILVGILKLFFYMLPRMLVLGTFYNILVFLATRSVKRRFKDRFPNLVRIYFFGAKFLNPIHLAICFIVATNTDLKDARESGLESEVIEATKESLARYRYPKGAISEVGISFVSRENIDAAGGYLQYFS